MTDIAVRGTVSVTPFPNGSWAAEWNPDPDPEMDAEDAAGAAVGGGGGGGMVDRAWLDCLAETVVGKMGTMEGTSSKTS